MRAEGQLNEFCREDRNSGEVRGVGKIGLELFTCETELAEEGRWTAEVQRRWNGSCASPAESFHGLH